MYVHRRRTRIEIWTPAKLNLYLEVLGRRADGYHEIETLMVPIGLFDTLCLSPRADGRIALKSAWAAGVARRTVLWANCHRPNRTWSSVRWSCFASSQVCPAG